MFDRYNFPGGASRHHHDHRVEVNEHRAPTDDSVKLLREMEQAAMERVISSMPVPMNEFSGRVAAIKEPWDQSVSVIVRAKLNGAEIEAKATEHLSLTGSQRELEEKLVLALRDALAKKIAETMLVDFTAGMRGKLLP